MMKTCQFDLYVCRRGKTYTDISGHRLRDTAGCGDSWAYGSFTAVLPNLWRPPSHPAAQRQRA